MSNGKYCYPDSDVLINKYHIHDRQLLEKLEIQKVAVKLTPPENKSDFGYRSFDVSS